MLSQERERERVERERKRLGKGEKSEKGGDGMDVSGEEEEDLPSCASIVYDSTGVQLCGLIDTNIDSSIEAPPSFMPQRHYCDITGLEVR